MFKTIDGRKFKCIKCGKCCRWSGVVYLEEEDISNLADNLTEGNREEFLSKYGDTVGLRDQVKSIILANKPNSRDCVFLNRDKCNIYEYRPKQCRDYPVKYDAECPGFFEERKAMSSDMVKKVLAMNKKLNSHNDFERSVSDRLYSGLKKEASSVSVAAKAIENGVSSFFEDQRIKLANLDDLFAFNRVDNNHLIHKSTKDLWAIEADESGDVHITRLFESGKPVKG